MSRAELKFSIYKEQSVPCFILIIKNYKLYFLLQRDWISIIAFVYYSATMVIYNKRNCY